MDRYEVMAGKMAPLTDGAHRKWGFTGKVETRSYLCSVSVCNLCGYLALWVAGILVCYIYRQQGTKVFPARGFQNPPQTPSRDWKDNGYQPSDHHGQPHARCGASQKGGRHERSHLRTRHQREEEGQRDRRICRCAVVCRLRPVRCASRSACSLPHQGEEGFGGRTAPLPLLDEERGEAPCPFRPRDRYRVCGLEGCREGYDFCSGAVCGTGNV